jgi:hypothetical protein
VYPTWYEPTNSISIIYYLCQRKINKQTKQENEEEENYLRYLIKQKIRTIPVNKTNKTMCSHFYECVFSE